MLAVVCPFVVQFVFLGSGLVGHCAAKLFKWQWEIGGGLTTKSRAPVGFSHDSNYPHLTLLCPADSSKILKFPYWSCDVNPVINYPQKIAHQKCLCWNKKFGNIECEFSAFWCVRIVECPVVIIFLLEIGWFFPDFCFGLMSFERMAKVRHFERLCFALAGLVVWLFTTLFVSSHNLAFDYFDHYWTASANWPFAFNYSKCCNFVGGCQTNDSVRIRSYNDDNKGRRC